MRDGLVTVHGEVLAVERPDNPLGSYELRRLAPGLRAQAAALKTELQQAGAGRVWVQAVVVVWSSLPQAVVGGDRVVFLQGDELVHWLRARPANHSAERVEALTHALDALTADPTAPSN